MQRAGSKFREKVGADNEREKARGSSYGHLMLPRGIKMFQVQGGDRVKLDFLPYTVTDEHHPCRNDEREVAVPGTQWYRRPYKLHRNIGAGNDSAVCLTSIGKKCPVCEYKVKLAKENRDEEEIKALKASDRNLYVVVPIGHKEFDEVPHIFDISRFCFQDMLREETDENPEYRAFFDPSEEGFTVNVRFSEEKVGKNKFAAASRIDFEERKKAYTDDVLKRVPNLDECLTVMSYKELEAKFFEMEAEEPVPPEIDETAETRPRRVVRPVKEETEEDSEQRRRDARREQRATQHSPEDEACVACQGTGENSRGATCPICRGSGLKKPNPPKEESRVPARTTHEESDEEPVDPPKRMVRRAKPEPVKSNKQECPHGHVFGTDCDKFPKHCSDCAVWDACFDASEGGA